MNRPTDAELEKVMRLSAARVLQAIDCPCPSCYKATVACSVALGVLSFVSGRPIDLRQLAISKTFAEQIASLADDKHVATYLSDPRMAEILPPGN